MTIERPMFPPLVPAASPTSRRSILFGLAAGVVASPAVASSLRPAVTEPAAETALSGLAPGVAAPSEVDPIFAVIAEHWAAQEATLVACQANDLDVDEDPNKEAAENRVSAAELPLFTTAPTTVAGAAALLAYVGSDAHETNQDPPDEPPITVLEYAAGWAREELKAAVQRFPLHVGAALRSMIGQQTQVVQPAEPDPIFAAITAHRELTAEWVRLYDIVDEAEHSARKEHGHRPIALIDWRNYHIGGSEIDYRREEWLRLPPAGAEKIESEYRDAKARYQAQVQAGDDWDDRTGVASHRERSEGAADAMRKARSYLFGCEPTTIKGAIALLRYVRELGVEDEGDLNVRILADALEKIEGAKS